MSAKDQCTNGDWSEALSRESKSTCSASLVRHGVRPDATLVGLMNTACLENNPAVRTVGKALLDDSLK